MKEKVYLICDSFDIKDIIRRPKNDKFWEHPDYAAYQVLEWSFEEEEPWAVGNALPIRENYRYRVIKQLGPIKILKDLEQDWAAYHHQSMVKLEAKPRQLAHFKKQVKQLDLDKMKESYLKILAKENVLEMAAEKNYRTYRVRGYCFEIAELMLQLVGDERKPNTVKELIAQLEELQFGNLLIKVMYKLNLTRYADYQNQEDAWEKDEAVLLSGFFIYTQAFEKLLQFAIESKHEKITPETLNSVFNLWLPAQEESGV